MLPYKAVIKKSVPFPWWVTNLAFRVPRDPGSFLLLVLLVRVHLLLSVKWVLVLVTQLCSQRRRRCRITFHYDGDDLTELYIFSTSWEEKFGDVAFLLHFEVNDGLICFDAAESLARLNLIAYFLVPGGDVTLKKMV